MSLDRLANRITSHTAVMEPWEISIWAPGARLAGADPPADLRALAQEIGSGRSLLERLGRRDPGLGLEVLAALLGAAAPDAVLLLLCSDQPASVDAGQRAGDTAPFARLLAEAVSLRGGVRALGASGGLRIEVAPISRPIIDLEGVVSDLLDFEAFCAAAESEHTVALVRGAGPAPLQLAAGAALGGARSRVTRQLELSFDPPTGETTLDEAGFAFPAIVQGAFGWPQLVSSGREHLRAGGLGLARAALGAAADAANAAGVVEADRLATTADLADLAWRLEETPSSEQQREGLADRLLAAADDPPEPLVDLAELLPVSTDAYVGIRVQRALSAARTGADADAKLEVERVNGWLAGAGEHRPVRAPDGDDLEAWAGAVVAAVDPAYRRVVGFDVTRWLVERMMESTRFPLASGPAGRSIGLFVIGGALPEGDRALAVLESLLTAAVARESSLEALIVMGISQEEAHPLDTASRVEPMLELIESGRREGRSPGLGDGTELVGRVLVGDPSKLGHVGPATVSALAGMVRHGDSVVLLQHGGAPALVHAAMAAAFALGAELRAWRTPSAADPRPVEIPVAAAIRATRERQTRRDIARRLARQRAAGALADLDDSDAGELRTAAAALEAADRGIPPCPRDLAGLERLVRQRRERAALADLRGQAPPATEASRVARLRLARARADLLRGRPDEGLRAAADALLELAGRRGEAEPSPAAAPPSEILGARWARLLERTAQTLATPSRREAIEAIIDPELYEEQAAARALDGALVQRLVASGVPAARLDLDPVAPLIEALEAHVAS